MALFETTLLLLLVAILLLQLTRRLPIPYPTVLAMAGVAVAALPWAPDIGIDPALALALFIAPAVFDAAYDFPPRDVRRYWIPLVSLAAIAVVLTTAVVAWMGVHLAGLPLAAAVALGAIVAPPDAAAATAVLGRFPRLPRNMVTVLKGESLLNDAVALLIFSAAVGLTQDPEHVSSLLPSLSVAAPGGLLFGYLSARVAMAVLPRLSGQLSEGLLGFVFTFGVWIVAERLRLSAVLAVVTYGMVVAQLSPQRSGARDRVHVYSVWNTVVFMLNVLAFLLLGLQARAVVERLAPVELGRAMVFAGAVLLAVIVTRMLWLLVHNFGVRALYALRQREGPSLARSVLVGWCGMRGLVTLATALALPGNFPQRDLIVLTALTVVLGTLVLQGVTLGPLIRWLNLPPDDSLAREIAQTRAQLIDAALNSLTGDTSPPAQRMREIYQVERDAALRGERPNSAQPTERFKRLGLKAKRARLLSLRRSGVIGDDVFHALEHELDWQDLANAPPERFELDEA